MSDDTRNKNIASCLIVLLKFFLSPRAASDSYVHPSSVNLIYEPASRRPFCVDTGTTVEITDRGGSRVADEMAKHWEISEFFLRSEMFSRVGC